MAFLFYSIPTPKVKTKGENGNVPELGVSCNANAIRCFGSPHIHPSPSPPFPSLPPSLPLSHPPSPLCKSPVKCFEISVVLMDTNNIEVISEVLGAGGNAQEESVINKSLWPEYLEMLIQCRWRWSISIPCSFFNFYSLSLYSIKWFCNWKYLLMFLKSQSFILPLCERCLYILF